MYALCMLFTPRPFTVFIIYSWLPYDWLWAAIWRVSSFVVSYLPSHSWGGCNYISLQAFNFYESVYAKGSCHMEMISHDEAAWTVKRVNIFIHDNSHWIFLCISLLWYYLMQFISTVDICMIFVIKHDILTLVWCLVITPVCYPWTPYTFPFLLALLFFRLRTYQYMASLAFRFNCLFFTPPTTSITQAWNLWLLWEAWAVGCLQILFWNYGHHFTLWTSSWFL